MGPVEQILGMLPGFGAMKELKQAREQVDEKQFARVEAIINSMTAKERRNHQLINGQRRKRIAKGSGTSVEEVNRLLKQFIQMKKMLKAMGGMAGLAKGKRPNLGALKGLMRLGMVVIRLRRAGSKKRPFFRVVVTDSRAARDSSFVEVLGHYNPRTKPETLQLDRERVDHWLKRGAIASDTVRTLIVRNPAPAAEAAAAAPAAS
jgi:ribosomal protein S16